MSEENRQNGDFRAALKDTEILYEHAPCGYLSFMADGTIVKLNQTLLTWLGYDRAEVEDKMNYGNLVTRGGKVYYEMFYMPLLQLQSHVNEISFDFVRKDGSKFPALVNSSVFKDEHNKLMAVNATVYDITDRRKYERELLQAKRVADTERTKFELLSNFIPEMVFTTDPTGQITYVNQRFSDFFGLEGNDISNLSILSKVHRRDRFKLLRIWKLTETIGKDFLEEVQLERYQSVFQWHLLRVVPVKAADGTIEKWIGSCTDVDKHVKAIQHLDEFISVASHELKTPITSIHASLQLMEKMISTADNPKLSMLMGQANRNVTKINTLVHDLLNTGNIKEGQMLMNKSRISVPHLLEETCPHIRLADEYHIHIECEDGLHVLADEHRIDQILVNFVNNAVKYAPESKDIRVIAKSVDGMVKISVSDSGPGIQKEKLPYIFDRYYRISHEGTGYSGLGLGLYICSEIIRRHGGEIGVESTFGAGSTFWFTLPSIE
ncbi:MAG: PAS domain S-box protein [Sphingobacteriales bacterium]|nr:MAG: PAS domain S-box protein [Sphingobacteriales bacterium]